MNTDILSPKALFQKDVQYVIPPFQRPYVWTQDEQWEPLWEDVRNVAESYTENLARFDDLSLRAEQKTNPHFLGAVVLKQVPTSARDIEQREVIDGQQRVTTLQLLIDAVQEVFEELGFTSEGKRLSKLVANDEDWIGDDSTKVFKLRPTRIDQTAFTFAMSNDLTVDEFEDSLIVQAHDFFKLQVKTWLTDGRQRREKRAEALEAAVTAMLQMVVIDLDTDDDPHMIFETLNARGTQLEHSDLIKNFVLSELPSKEDFGSDVWSKFDDRWWREEVKHGRVQRPRLDMLINYWLSMRTGAEVSPVSVFTTFRQHASDRILSDIMIDLNRDLGNYRAFECETRTAEQDLFHYRLDVIKAGAIMPALLVLFNAPYDSQIRAFRVLESFLVRRMICRYSARQYGGIAIDLASKLLDHDLSEADEVVERHLKSQTSYSFLWPDDNAIRTAFAESPLYRILTRGRLRVVLEGIERQLRSPLAESADVPRDLTIEHVMPQNWALNWPLVASVDAQAESETRNELIHTIGNLTLVNQRLNTALSNSPWDFKRNWLQEHSVLVMNREFRDRNEWSEQSIQERSGHLADQFLKAWPGPTKGG